MTCPKKVPEARKQTIAKLFAGGNAKAAAWHRLQQCLRASDCGHLCDRLVKGPGKLAFCVEIHTGAKVELYPALERQEFGCPENRF